MNAVQPGPVMDAGPPTLVFGDKTCSMDEIDAAARRAAGGLQHAGLREPDAVAVILRNDFPWFVLHQATRYLGFDLVPVNWHLKPAEIALILSDCKAKAVIVHADLLTTELAKIIPCSLVVVVAAPAEISTAPVVKNGKRGAAPGFVHWARWIEQSPEFEGAGANVRPPLFYTSGTSGRPKAVLRKNATPEIAAKISERTRLAWGFDKTPIRSAMTGPLHHSAPNGYGNMVLQSGGLLVLMARFDARELLRLIERHELTHLHLVPTMFVRLLALPEGVRNRHKLDSLKHVVHGAAPCPAAVKRRMIDWWGSIIHEYYGMTETGIITCSSSAEWLARAETVGRPAPGVELEIRDEQGNRLGSFEEGAIHVRHEGTHCVSYLNRGDAAAGLGPAGFLATGDIGWVDEDGFLRLASRQSDMVISGGVNIYPAEVEAELIAMDEIADCVVFGVPEPEFGEQLVAVVERSGALSETEIIARLAARLADFKIPKIYEFTSRLPRADSGKINKRQIKEDYLASAANRR